jgi:hypothetical protein
MDLSKILSISGKPGLFKVVAQTKNGVVVESLLDGKRFTAFANDRISSLKEISVFTEVDDIPLRDVLKSIFEKQEGKAAINHKSGNNELKAFFEKVLADYDKERVYVSDIKKIIQWYNLLLEKEILNFDEEEEKTEDTGDTPEDSQEEKENTENK